MRSIIEKMELPDLVEWVDDADNPNGSLQNLARHYSVSLEAVLAECARVMTNQLKALQIQSINVDEVGGLVEIDLGSLGILTNARINGQ